MKNIILLFIFFLINILADLNATAFQKDNTVIYFCSNKFGNPWLENSSYDCWTSFMIAVLGTLVSIDNNGDLKPSMLESFEWDFEKNYYRLRLRNDLYFQNGRKVTAEDLEFSILRSFFAKNKTIGEEILFDLKGIEKIKHGQPYQSGLVEGVQILDDRTVSFAPTKFNPVFLYNLVRPHYSLVPLEEFEDDLETWKKWPIGVGAYKIDKQDKENKGFYLSLSDAKNYPKAPKTIFYEQERIFEPDITTRDSISTKEKKYQKEVLFISLFRRLFSFNFSNRLSKNKDFRKAVFLSLSRSEIVASTDIETMPLYELITRGNIGRINVKEEYDVKEASRLFKKVLGAKNKKKVFKIPYSPDNSYLGYKYKEIMKSQFAKVGFHVEFQEMKDDLLNIFEGEFKNSPFCLISSVIDFSDSRATFYTFTKGSKSVGRIYQPPDNDIFEKLIIDTKEANSRSDLNYKLEKLSWYFYENILLVPLFEAPNVVYYNPNKILSIGKQFGESIFYLHNLEMKVK